MRAREGGGIMKILVIQLHKIQPRSNSIIVRPECILRLLTWTKVEPVVGFNLEDYIVILYEAVFDHKVTFQYG